MSEFFVTLAKVDIANQIASMVNMYNRWYTTIPVTGIMNTQANYYIELYGDKVVACAGIMQEFDTLSKIIHVCVLPEFRRRNLASKLLKNAINNCKTEFVYMKAREDNIGSLSLAKSLGFKFIEKNWFMDHFTQTLARRK